MQKAPPAPVRPTVSWARDARVRAGSWRFGVCALIWLALSCAAFLPTFFVRVSPIYGAQSWTVANCTVRGAFVDQSCGAFAMTTACSPGCAEFVGVPCCRPYYNVTYVPVPASPSGGVTVATAYASLQGALGLGGYLSYELAFVRVLDYSVGSVVPCYVRADRSDVVSLTTGIDYCTLSTLVGISISAGIVGLIGLALAIAWLAICCGNVRARSQHDQLKS